MQQDDNQKNLLLAVVLSVLILIGWQYFFINPKLQQEQEKKAREQAQQTQVKPGVPGVAGTPATSAGGTAPTAAQPGAASVPAAATPLAATVSRADALKLSPRVPIETPSYQGSIALKGARIDDLLLANYHETVDPKSPKIVLLSPSGAPEPYYAEFGWMAPQGSTVALPSADTVWKVESGAKLGVNAPVTLAWDNGQGITFRRKIAVDAESMFTVEDSFENKGAAPVSLDHRSVLSRHGTPVVAGYYILHEGPIGYLGDKHLQELKYADILKGVKDGDHSTKAFDKITGGWMGITDKYWATALVPSQKTPFDAYVTGYQKTPAGVKESYQIDVVTRGVTAPPAQSQSVTMELFAGAKKVNLIEAYEKSRGILRFDMMVDWGWFSWITKPLFHLIDWMATFFAKMGFKANFGLAILFVTVLVKAAFFPLANKSYESMAKMKKLQPKMEELRERFKDDKARQQQELMKLYQEQKINPMAGCLPVVLQIPVFFALYKVLFITIDMRQAPFYGWVRDLSAPDPSSLFNLFGLIPVTLPEFLHVGAWPIIMGMTMWVQMQLNPQQPDPVQQKIFNWMPVMFTFMLASFPVGLVIYWAWSNVLSLVQQYYINKKNGAEIHLWKNLGIEKLLARLNERKS